MLAHRKRNADKGNGFGFHLADVNGKATALVTDAMKSNSVYVGYDFGEKSDEAKV